MTKKSYSTLDRKIHEIHYKLQELLHLPPETQNHHISEEIYQNLVFAARLLKAENSSGPSNRHHLEHIAARLKKQFSTYTDWESKRIMDYPNDIDNTSTCSCTESCLNDDDVGEASDELSLSGFADPEELSQGFDGEKALVAYRSALVEEMGLAEEKDKDKEEEEEEKEEDKTMVGFEKNQVLNRSEERRVLGFWSMCGVMVIGMVLGISFMSFAILKFCCCFHYVEPTFTVPT